MENKEKFGEVITPLEIVNEMFSYSETFILKYLTESSRFIKINILDVGTGDGKFIKCFIEKYPILSKNIIFYGIEKNINCKIKFDENIKTIKNFEDYNIKFVNSDITEEVHGLRQIKFHLIMGNPPFNNNGLIKVPCNNKMVKKNEGKSIWHTCILHSLELICDKGFLLMVSPCLWLKPDKSGTYENIVNKNNLIFIKSYDSKESHKIFKYKAQTPVNYFLVEKNINKPKTIESNTISIYNIKNDKFKFDLKNDYPIPTHNIEKVIKCQEIIKKYKIGDLSRIILKTNPVDTKKFGIINKYSETSKYKNIKTCILNRETNNYDVVYEYSKISCPFYNSSKIYCSHKRLPIFFEDYNGAYGISRRDTYVISEVILNEVYAPQIVPNNSRSYLKLLYHYVSSKFVRSICMSTRYRMNFLEKYAYKYVPNIVEYYMKIKDINEMLSNAENVELIDYVKLVNDFVNLCESSSNKNN